MFHTFLHLQSHVELVLNTKILCLQTNWGGEYRRLNNFFQQIGIEHHVSCPHTHQQNGSVERKHRHIVEMGLTLLSQSSMPIRFWDEAFLIACHLINHLPTRVLQNCSPIEKLFRAQPDYTLLCIFNCSC